MLKKLIISVFVIMLCNLLYSNDIAYKYSKFIPVSISNNPLYMKMISQNIEKYGQIHPYIIYFYLEELKYKTDKSIDNKIRLSAIQDLQGKRLKFIEERNNWAQNQISILNKLDLNRQTRKESIKYFKKIIIKKMTEIEKVGSGRINQEGLKKLEKRSLTYIADSIGVIDNYKFSVDSSLLNYFVLLYRNPDFQDEYSQLIDYKSLLDELNNSLIELYREIIKNKDANSKNVDLNEFLSNWYILNDKTQNNRKIDPAEYVSMLVRRRYINVQVDGFSTGMYYSSYLISPSIEKKIYINGLDENITVKEEASLPSVGLNVDYNFILKKELDSFSYLNVQIGYGQSLGTKKINFDAGFYFNGETGEGTRAYRSLEFVVNEINIKSVQNFSLKLNIPIYLIGNNIILEGGLFLDYLYYKYKLSYSYYYINRVSYPTVGAGWVTETIGAGTGNELDASKTYKDFIIYPILGLRYRVFKSISIYIGTIPSNFSFEISYSFN
jgi:hypothetical protein